MSFSVFDLFKIGIGPSSSHTVGPMVAARRFISECRDRFCLDDVSRVQAEFFGSLGATGRGHGTDKAVILGFEGDCPASVEIATIEQRLNHINKHKYISLLGQHTIGFDQSSELIFHRKRSLPQHANGMCFRAFLRSGEVLIEKQYYSIGGGFIVDQNGFAKDTETSPESVEQHYPFESGADLLALCHEHSLSIAQIMLRNESAWQSETETLSGLDNLWATMQDCVARGCEQEGQLPGGLKVQRRAKALYKRLSESAHGSLDCDPLETLDWVTLYALAVNEENASGGRVVTAPTNGAAGIIPAVLHYYANFIPNASRQGIHEFLLTAAAIGVLFKKNASISGAEVGCQGEVGSACSMAAAGLTAVLSGSPEQIENAAEIAMEHHLGLTCDPIGGLVQVPCIERNAVASIKAIHASRMALASNGQHIVSLDKVIKTMRDTGRDMLEKYKETSRGGLAVNVVEVPVNIIEC